VPSSVAAQIARIAAIFAPEKPQARSSVSELASTRSGGGKVPDGYSASNRARIASTARPCSCWCAIARISAS